MAKLEEILRSINEDLINLQVKSDMESVRILNDYLHNDVLKYLDAPRFTISGINLNLKFTVSEVGETTKYDFNNTRKDWLATTKNLPADQLREYEKLNKDEFLQLVDKHYTKTEAGAFDTRRLLLGEKNDFAQVSVRSILSSFQNFPDERKQILSMDVSNISERQVNQAILSSENKETLKKDLMAMADVTANSWIEEIRSIPETIVPIESIEGLTLQEKANIVQEVDGAFSSVGRHEFSCRDALTGKMDKTIENSMNYFQAVYDILPSSIKSQLSPDLLSVGDFKADLSNELNTKIPLMKISAQNIVNSKLKGFWPDIVKERFGVFLESYGELSKGEKESIHNLTRQTREPQLSVESVLNNVVPESDLSSFLDDSLVILKRSAPRGMFKGLKKSDLKNSLNISDALKSTLPLMQRSVDENTGELWQAELNKIGARRIIATLDQNQKETAFREIKDSCGSIDLGNTSDLVFNAFLGEKDAIYSTSVKSIHNSFKDLPRTTLERIPSNLLSETNIKGKLQDVYERTIGIQSKEVNKLIGKFANQWNDELKKIAENVIEELFVSYGKMADTIGSYAENITVGLQSIIISDEDLKKATELNLTGPLVENTSDYLVKLMQNMPQSIRNNLPIGFSDKRLFRDLIEKRLNKDLLDRLKESVIKKTELSALDINVRNQDVESSKVVNEIFIELKPNFIKIIKDE
jgi:hypothetical protein